MLAYPHIDPVAVEIGPLPIRWYALAYIAAFIVGWGLLRAFVTRPALWRPGQPRPGVEALDDLVAYAAMGVIIGGRLGHVLIYDPAYYLAQPLEILQTWKGGMAFHGGLIGALAGLALFARREALPFATIVDLVAAASPPGLFFGRLANFIKPEMWGRPADVPWAMVFPGAGDLPRHPSQLYEAGLEGLALGALLLLAAKLGAFRRPVSSPASLASSMARRASSASFSASPIRCRRRCRAASPWAWRCRRRLSFSAPRSSSTPRREGQPPHDPAQGRDRRHDRAGRADHPRALHVAVPVASKIRLLHRP